jgi:heat shock protein HtpX
LTFYPKGAKKFMFKRIFWFLAVNILVVATISIILSVLGIQPYLTARGLNYESLLIFCLVWGMGGAFISLALSRIMAKAMMGVKVIDQNARDPQLQELVQRVHQLAKGAGLPAMPEVGIYDSPEINAFATGPSKSRSLVAVSTGLLRRMNRQEADGVLAHEVAHIANGDMVTMTLIQGVVNAFAMFLARVIAYAVASVMGRGEEREGGGISTAVFFVTQIVLEIVFMILGSLVVAFFSRLREYRADQGGARYAGREKMIAALEALRRNYDTPQPAAQPSVQTLKISNHGSGIFRLFSTHPPLEERIARLRNGR